MNSTDLANTSGARPRWLWRLVSPALPRAKAVTWRKAILSEEWLGYIGDVWTGAHLFTVKREDFIETGETFCLDSQLNAGCVCCYPTLEAAQSRAQEQWQQLVQRGVELG